MKNALVIFTVVLALAFLVGCTVKSESTQQVQPRQAQPQYQVQPPRTTRLNFQYHPVQKKAYVAPPTSYPTEVPKPKTLR